MTQTMGCYMYIAHFHDEKRAPRLHHGGSMLNGFTVQATVIMLPAISRVFNIPPSRQQMIMLTYSVASGSSMLLWGRIADVHGRWGVFLAGTTLFAIFTLLIPFAPSELFLYMLSGLQGFSSAATVPSGIGILASMFQPGPDRNRAYVALVASSSVDSVFGNIAGGAIGGLLSWRWGFWIPAGLAAIIALSACILWPRRSRFSSSSQTGGSTHHRDQSVDYIGGLLISTSLALLQVGLSQGNVEGWVNFHVPSLICASVILGVIFATLQLRMERSPDKHPLVRLSMFKNVSFSAAFLVVACFFGSFNSFLVFASMFFQDILKPSMLKTTLYFLPGGIIGGLVCFLVTPALSLFRGFYMLMFGFICSIISPLLFALLMGSQGGSVVFNYWVRGFPAMCLCLSAEVVWPVIGLYVARGVAEADQSLAGALLQAANHIGRGLGMALAAAAQVIVSRSSHSLLLGIQAAQWTNVGMATLSLLCTLIFFRGLDTS
ncbi:unnamed protein product [Clonostachys solani]|uniref:Major facilitator superfamily (MFS) profile domain-containing protein n=1 Tax=Clonostachys solani TaxID=160281 RepID=A0A9N9Z1D1_9HYPO|nr:unnamed protein product [Clonostachys solani]